MIATMLSVCSHCFLITMLATITFNIQCISGNSPSAELHSRHVQRARGHDASPEKNSRHQKSQAMRNRRSISEVALPADIESEYNLYEVNPKRSWSTGKNMAVWGKRDQFDDVNDYVRDDKRKWSGGNMAVWGKRGLYGDDETQRDEKRKWGGGNMAVWGKRKWSSGNMAVWGKRRDDEEEKKRNNREDENLDEEKRKWNEKLAVWG